MGTKRLGRKRSECVCRLGVTLCNEGIVGGRDKAGDGIASDWDCEAVRGDGIVLFLSKNTYSQVGRRLNVSYMLCNHFCNSMFLAETFRIQAMSGII